jgi:hypothetical protein
MSGFLESSELSLGYILVRKRASQVSARQRIYVILVCRDEILLLSYAELSGSGINLAICHLVSVRTKNVGFLRSVAELKNIQSKNQLCSETLFKYLWSAVRLPLPRLRFLHAVQHPHPPSRTPVLADYVRSLIFG